VIDFVKHFDGLEGVIVVMK